MNGFLLIPRLLWVNPDKIGRMAAVNPNDPRPPYVQIADDLRRAITSGELKPRDRLESGRDLAKRYGVAPMTVNSAISALRDEGLLTSWQGRGVFVADPLPATPRR